MVLVVVLSMAAMGTASGAITLAQSFSGGTYFNAGAIKTSGQYHSKSCYAQTKGYSGKHYVRAYVGGSNNDPAKAWADTGRCYSTGDIKKTCTTSQQLIPRGTLLSSWFPTGYAKYGTS